MYELAMEKIFLHGRTEAIYAEFVRTFWDYVLAEKKVQALRIAC
jgi:hypothetical protein